MEPAKHPGKSTDSNLSAKVGRRSKQTVAVLPWRRFAFGSTVYAKIRVLRSPGNLRGIFEVAKDPAICVAAAWLSLQAWYYAPLALGLLAYVIAVVVIGARQRGMADSLHCGTHRSLASNTALNYALATFASGYLVLQGYRTYFASHVLRHHPFLGDPFLDPDHAELCRQGLYGERRGSAAVKKYLRRIVSFKSTMTYLKMLLKERILGGVRTMPAARNELVVRVLYWIVIASLITLFNGWHLVLAYWILPLLTTANWLGQLIELLEHYPFMETRPRIDLYMTRNRIMGPIGRWLLGTHHEGYHLVHHLFEWLPPWRLKAAHKILMQVPEYACLHTEFGVPAIVRAVLREADSAPMPVLRDAPHFATIRTTAGANGTDSIAVQ